VLLARPICGQAVEQDLLRDAAAAYESGDIAAAIGLYREFLKDHPGAAEIRSNLGAALVRDGRFEEAIAEYEAALKMIPNNRRVRMNLALAYYKLGQLPEAMQELKVLHEAQPLDAKPALLLADCLMETGQAPDAADLLAPLHEEYADDHAITYLFGMALLKAKRSEQAQAVLEKLLGQGESAEGEFLLGQTEFMRQDHVSAAAHLSKAIQLNPKLPGAHSLYGQVLRLIGKLDDSTEQFRQELEVNPYDFVANTQEAMLLKKSGDYDHALIHVGRALQVRPRDPGALYERASILMVQGKHEQALQELEPLVRSYPDFYEAHLALAAVYYRLHRKEDGDREHAEARRVQQATEKRLEENRNRNAEGQPRQE
jgi:tetratricopeptide (TPR) repeat protein